MKYCRASSGRQHHSPYRELTGLAAQTAAAMVAILLCASSVRAAVDTWKTTSGGNWALNANWTDGSLPLNGDSATFHQPTLFPTITFNVNPAAIQALNVTLGGWIFASSGGARTLNVNSGGTQTVTVGTALVLGSAGNPMHLNTETLNVNHVGSNSALFIVGNGSHATSTTFNVGTTSGGSVQVDGAGSELRWSGTANVGANGFSGELLFQNSASTSPTTAGPVVLGSSNIAGTAGTVNIESNADATFATLGMASEDTDVGTATLNIQGNGSTLTMFSFMTVGNAGAGTAAVNIGTTASGGSLTTGSAGLVLNPGGTITVGSASTSGSLDVARRLNVQGGRLIFNNGFLNYSDMSVSNGGSVTVAGDLDIDKYGSSSSSLRQSVTLSSGSISVGGRVNIGYDREHGTLSVGGPNSSIVAHSASSSFWGDTGGTEFSTVNAGFGSGATGSFNGGITIRGSDYQCFFTVQSGAHVSVGNLSVNGFGDLDGTANITATGAGSRLGLIPGSVLTLGSSSTHPSAGTAVLNIADNALVEVEAGGGTVLNRTGTINLNGGTLSTPSLTINNGALNFTSGTLGITGPAGLTFGAGGPLGTSYLLGPNAAITVLNTTTINAGSSFVLDGGTLNTGGLVTDGGFAFRSGVLNFITAGGGWTAPIVVQELDTAINVSAASVSLGNAGSFSGFHHAGELNVASGSSVTLNSAGYARLGVITSLAGGALHAPNGIYLPGGSNLLGSGIVNARIAADAGSVIEASGPLVLGSPGSPAGFDFDGDLYVDQHSITLNSAGIAGLGSFTSLGSSGVPGTLMAPNGVFVDYAEAIVGHGTVDSQNLLARRCLIDGIAMGESMAEPLIFNGYVKGLGIFDNVRFRGTFDLDGSPAIVEAGNLAFESTNRLIIELGGTGPGSFDQIHASGHVAFDGELRVVLVNGFVPPAGATFRILTYASREGAFRTVTGISVGAGRIFRVQYNPSDVTLVVSAPAVADLDADGDVDIADLELLSSCRTREGLAHSGSALCQSADFDHDTDVDSNDFGVYQRCFSGANVAPACE